MFTVCVIYIVYFIRIVLTVLRPLPDMVLDVVHWVFYGGTKPLPCIHNRMLLMSATELAKKIRKKELSAAEVMKAYVDRIKAVQPIVNACVDSRFEEALADARAVDEMLEAGIKTEEELAKTMPLLGVPFTCKEIIGVKNLSQTWGLLRFKNRKAPTDSAAVTLYKKAGAIPVAVTNIPSLSMWWDSSNPVFGATKNPYNNNRIAGGSSGGEASIISSAGAVIGIGNDLAGSIRIPASFCGIYGHKPTAGVISNKTDWPEMPNTSDLIKNMDRFLCTGPMCRYSEDLHPLLKVLCGDNYEQLRLDEKVDFKNFTVYYMEEFPGFLLSSTSDVRASVKNAVKYFDEKHGATTRKLEMKELKYAFHIWQSKLYEAGVAMRSVQPDIEGFIREIWEFLKSLFGASEFDLNVLYHAGIEFRKTDKFYEKCLAMYATIQKELDKILNGNAILILPMHPEPATHSILTIPKFMNIAYTCIFNVLGLPATVVPAGQSKGLPIGLQVIAKKNNDHFTLAAAVELDNVFGGWRNPCPLSVFRSISVK